MPKTKTAKKKVVKTDIETENLGSIILFRPLNDGANEWLRDVTGEETTWYGDALAVEHRYAGDLAEGASEYGYVVRPA